MKINKIVVVGGGSAGWMSAATLIRTFPNKNISVIESKDVPIVGVGESTLGHITRWTKYIGLDEKDFFPYTDASYKMSIKFTDFYKKDSGGFHYPFGKPLALSPERNPFYDWHLKKYFYPETPIQDFVNCLFPAAALFQQNKYSKNEFLDFDNYDPTSDVAYHFDAIKFGNWLRERYCIPRGVNHIIGTVTDIKTNEQGVEYLTLDNGGKITADLYVDCTGFKSLLLGGALKEPFDSYEKMLPNNRAWATRIPYKDKRMEIEPFTNSTAIENGWCWNIPLWSRLGAGYAYSDKFINPEEAKEQFKEYLMSEKMVVPRTKEEVEELEYRDIKMRVGIHKETFVKNVVGIGLAAGFIEPLESNGLYSVHEFLFKLIDILQRGEINQFDRDMYNTSVNSMFRGFSKFVALHYALSLRNDSEYWKANNNKRFSEMDNEMFSNSIDKAPAFSDMAWRYLDNWAHPPGDHGITYIATGMHYFMMNDSRVEREQKSANVDLQQFVNQQATMWEFKKAKWLRAAENEPNLAVYLANTFYTPEDL
jgi:tryptophan halogenase